MNEESIEKTKSGPRLHLQLWVRDFIISVMASFFIITFLYQPVKVEGTSMQPELRDQDRLFVNKFAYNFEKISRGDVVVFYYPRDPQKSYIKRVIGLPGDNIRIDDGRVYVNGQRIDESYGPKRFRDVRSMADMGRSAGGVFCDGRSPVDLERQPRLRPGHTQADLR